MINPLSFIGRKCRLKKAPEIDGAAGIIKLSLEQEFKIIAYDKERFKIICDIHIADARAFFNKELDNYTSNAIRIGLIKECEVFLWVKRNEFKLVKA